MSNKMYKMEFCKRLVEINNLKQYYIIEIIF